MKASSLFAVTVAALLGLGAVAGAKYAGLFDRVEIKQEQPPAIKILVARDNLFEGITISSSQVMVRDIRPEEMAAYQQNKEKYMPAMVAAAHMRVAAQNIMADTPLLREYFQDQELPADLTTKMSRYMRAVNVALPKERCGGGLLRVGEYVDIFLTSQIAGANDTPPVIQTACIARGVKIIVKRNSLWSTLVSQPGDIPINFTLMANPYRAALIEFAKTAGNLTMMPVPVPPEEQAARNSQARPTFSDINSAEYRDEDERVSRLERGELVVGSRDLERIFKLEPIPVPPPAPTTKQDVIVHYHGVNQHRVSTLPPVQVKPTPVADTNVKPATYSPGEKPAMGYRFYPPDSVIPKNKGTSDCPECDAARAAAARRQ